MEVIKENIKPQRTKTLTPRIPKDLYIALVTIKETEDLRTMPEAINYVLNLGVSKYKELKTN